MRSDQICTAELLSHYSARGHQNLRKISARIGSHFEPRAVIVAYGRVSPPQLEAPASCSYALRLTHFVVSAGNTFIDNDMRYPNECLRSIHHNIAWNIHPSPRGCRFRNIFIFGIDVLAIVRSLGNRGILTACYRRFICLPTA